MALRSLRERIVQTVCYEAGGIALAAPIYASLFGASGQDSFALITVLALALLVWSPIHNALFDWLDLRRTGRVASDRPHRWRIVHATSHEATSMLLTVPIIMTMTGLGFWPAAALDLGLTLFYIAYAYGFHLAFDRARPVKKGANPLLKRDLATRKESI